MSDIEYKKDEQPKQEMDLFLNPPFGTMISVIFGEVTYFNLKYTEGGLACLELNVSTKLPYKKFKDNSKFYYNRVTVWKHDAERLAKVIKKRDKDKKENGTFLLIWSNRFGGDKLDNGNFSHNFACLRYRIIDNVEEFLADLASNQDSNTIKLGHLFNLD